MRSDGRWIKNNKRVVGRKPKTYTSRGIVDARNILNQKRINNPKPPVLGSYMRTNTVKAAVSQIKKEIFSLPKEPNKSIQLSRDGNIIITSKSRNIPQMSQNNMPKFNFGTFSRNRFSESNEFQSSSGMDDLEHTAIEDVLDFKSLPQSYLDSKSLQTANLSRNSAMSRILNTEHFSRNSTLSRNSTINNRMLDNENFSRSPAMSRILDRKHTMVADQFSRYSNPYNKVFVSGLHSSVSRQDVMELFGEIGVIKSIEMGMPGTAVVEFFDEEDAVRACDMYHNRLLDGLPMKCYLKNSNTPHKFALSQRLGSRNESRYEPIHSDFSPVIFNARSRYNPHNVQFTVKLT